MRQSRIAPRTAIAKPLSAAVAIGTGGPFGAEGPIIVTGGALGSLLGQVLHVSASERKILLACGAAAGMAATFGAPLAAVVLAIELLLFEFSTRALVPLVVATSIAGAVHAATFGAGPLFAVPAHDFAGLAQLPWFAAARHRLRPAGHADRQGPVRRRARLPPAARSPSSWHPVVGAVAWASLGLLVPRALGVGYDVIDDVLAGRLAVATLAALAVGKLVIWWLALASGTSGGTLAPILIISSCTGGLLGELAARRRAVAVADVVRPRGDGGHVRRRHPGAVRGDRVRVRADPRLRRDPAADAGHRARRDRRPRSTLRESLMTEKLARRRVSVPGDYRPDVMAHDPRRRDHDDRRR